VATTRVIPAVARRAAATAAAVLLCAGAVAFYRFVPPPHAFGTVRPEPVTPPVQRAADALPAALQAPRPALAPGPTGGASSTHDGAGLRSPGVRLTATPRPDGGFEIAEQVILPVPATELLLRVAPPAAAGPAFARVRPRATKIQISAEDQPVPPVADVVGGPRTVALPLPASRFELRYQLTGGSVRSIPSTAGRALAALAPLTGGLDPTLPVTVVVGGNGALNLRCPLLAPARQACATGAAPRLAVRSGLTARSALVLVQLDLPRLS
jgi:hypothetical protein